MSQDIEEMAVEKRNREKEHQLNFSELITSTDLRNALFVGIGLMVAQQFSGWSPSWTL